MRNHALSRHRLLCETGWVPRRFIPHYNHLRGYPFPIVMDLIDPIRSRTGWNRHRVKYPKALRAVPARVRALLLASLACELSNLCVRVLVAGERSRRQVEIRGTLLRKHGKAPFLRLQSKLAQIHERQTELRIKRDGLEVEGATASEMDPVRRGLQRIARLEKELEVKNRRTEAAIARRKAAIERTEAYRKDLCESDWKHLEADFDRVLEDQIFPAAFFLRTKDSSWWTNFIRRFSHQVRKDAFNSPYKIALRDRWVLDLIQAGTVGRGQVTWYESAANYFQREQGEWGRKNQPATAAIIKWIRRQLCAEDRRAMVWLKRHGLTANFYSRWLVSLGTIQDEEFTLKYWSPGSLEAALQGQQSKSANKKAVRLPKPGRQRRDVEYPLADAWLKQRGLTELFYSRWMARQDGRYVEPKLAYWSPEKMDEKWQHLMTATFTGAGPAPNTVRVGDELLQLLRIGYKAQDPTKPVIPLGSSGEPRGKRSERCGVSLQSAAVGADKAEEKIVKNSLSRTRMPRRRSPNDGHASQHTERILP